MQFCWYKCFTCVSRITNTWMHHASVIRGLCGLFRQRPLTVCPCVCLWPAIWPWRPLGLSNSEKQKEKRFQKGFLSFGGQTFIAIRLDGQTKMNIEGKMISLKPNELFHRFIEVYPWLLFVTLPSGVCSIYWWCPPPRTRGWASPTGKRFLSARSPSDEGSRPMIMPGGENRD